MSAAATSAGTEGAAPAPLEFGADQRFAVHIYATFRVKIPTVEGASVEELLAKAEKSAGLHEMSVRGSYDGEFAEEITGYLIDPLDSEGEVDSERSLVLDGDGKPAPQETPQQAINRLKARIDELEAFTMEVARTPKDHERVVEPGHIVEDDEAELSSDDALDSLHSIISSARKLVPEAVTVTTKTEEMNS